MPSGHRPVGERGDKFGVGGIVADGVEADDMGEHHRHRLPVDDVVDRRERVGKGMGGTEHRVLDRHPGPRGAQLHRLTGRDIAGIGEHPR